MDTTDGDVKRGLSYLDKEDYENAFKTLSPCANTGNLEAQASIGVMYQLGLGVERDICKAIEWLQAAADNGHGNAAHNLGTLYLTCEPDIPSNPEKSEYWYKKAKELGFIAGTDDWYAKE